MTQEYVTLSVKDTAFSKSYVPLVIPALKMSRELSNRYLTERAK